jgi:Ca-activated chloride channel family protein
VYDFIHYRDANGKPDSVYVDPVLSYDIQVNTIPSILVREVMITPGTHNTISIPAPQGILSVTQPSTSEYKEDVRIWLRSKDSNEIINIQQINKSFQYLAGTYDVEITTVPKIKFDNIDIVPDQVQILELPAPGVVNLKSAFQGYGNLFHLHPDNGKQEWIMNFGNKMPLSQALQPGNYKAVFRTKNSKGSKYTQVREFIIESGESVTMTF